MDRSKPPFFGAFHALAVDDPEACRRVPADKLSCLRVEFMMHTREHAIAVPAHEIVVHDAFRGEVLRQLTPLTPGRQHIEDCVQNLAHIRHGMTPRFPRRRHKRRDKRPLFVSQIARISAVLALVGLTVT